MARRRVCPVRSRSDTRTLLTSLDWWRLQPRRDALRVDGKPNPPPGKDDLSPPQAASIGDETWVIYLPRGNAGRELVLQGVGPQAGPARWFNPRNGQFAGKSVSLEAGRLPSPPAAAEEDWVLVLDDASKDVLPPGQRK